MHRFLKQANFRLAAVCTASLAGLLTFPGHALFAMNCTVVRHAAPTEADREFLAGDFDKAAAMYKEALVNDPAQTEAITGLVHSLLRQQKVIEAADTVRSLIGDKPPSAALLTLRAEVELRQGAPWNAAETAAASAKLDTCNPRTILVFARLAELHSEFATARKLLAGASQLDPEDPDILAAWIDSLPAVDRIPQLEDYLAAPRGDDQETLDKRRIELDELKKWAEEPHPPCTMVSKTSAATIPFTALRTQRGDVPGPAVDVKVNDHRARLAIDTSYNARLPIEGVSGLLILKEAADHMGLKPLFQNTVPGIGPQGPRAGYVAYADSISIGDLEFHNCLVQAMEGRFWSDADGVMNLSLMSNFLISIDYPGDKLILSPLPPLPGTTPTNGPADGFIAPEMKDYTQVYRADTDLFMPVMVNRKFPMLFLIQTSFGLTMLSPEASHQVAGGHTDAKYEVRDTSGKVDTHFSGGDVQLFFAGLTKNITHIASFDTARFTMDSGMEISGFMGNDTFHDVTLRIDYRDGLMKLDFGPKQANAH